MIATKKIADKVADEAVLEQTAQSSKDVLQVATPAYWEDACKHLVKKDRVMKRLIPQFGDVC